MNGSRATSARSGLIDVACEGGQLLGDHAHGFLESIRGLERTRLEVGDPAPTVREALRAFTRLVLDGQYPPVQVEDGARAVLIAAACLRSAACGTAVPVEPWPP